MADNDAVFQEAVEALRAGNKNRARELLTGLLKTDQNNAIYWVWMSATVDTTKERIYCLQTAFKLDPQNVAAKRGLILHGALSADETIQPFPVNRPRAWEEKLLLAHEKPKPKGWEAVKASPVVRLGGFVALGVVLIGALVYGFLQAQAARAPSWQLGSLAPRSPIRTILPLPPAHLGVWETADWPTGRIGARNRFRVRCLLWAWSLKWSCLRRRGALLDGVQEPGLQRAPAVDLSARPPHRQLLGRRARAKPEVHLGRAL